jgi:hypothetical protein
MPFDKAIMPACDALLIAKMTGWEDSLGIAEEIKIFENWGKPMFTLDPQTLEIYRYK